MSKTIETLIVRNNDDDISSYIDMLPSSQDFLADPDDPLRTDSDR